MKIHARTRLLLRYLIPIIVIMTGVPFLERTLEEPEPFGRDTLRCVIAIPDKTASMSYPIGYNYEMLKLFVLETGREADIFTGGEDYADSLSDDKIDILVIPFRDSLITDERYYASSPLADSSSWLCNGRLKAAHKEINLWLGHFLLSNEHKELVARFTPSYDPSYMARSGKRYSSLSPYDKLISEYAADLGWDKNMLTALIWEESQFRIEAKSRRGAIGLMQVMPLTGSRFEADNLLDPKENIRAGVSYLSHIQRIFKSKGLEGEELMKFTIAAYNAGEGRILDCMNYAKAKGVSHSSWDELTAVIPDMGKDEILENDSVRLGKFKGVETMAYVEKVSRLYGHLNSATGSVQSSQDRHRTRKDTK